MKDLERTFATTQERTHDRLLSVRCIKSSLENLTINSFKFDTIFNKFIAEVKMNLNNFFKLILLLNKWAF